MNQLGISITYRTVATFLWLLVAVLLALTVSTSLDMPPRMLLFLMTVCVGIVLLIVVNTAHLRPTFARATAGKQGYGGQARLAQGETPRLLSPGVKTQAPTTPLTFVAPQATARQETAATVASKPHESRQLSRDEARQWLDDFLVTQQQK